MADQKDASKLAGLLLLAGGAYLVYRYVSSQLVSPGKPEGTTPPSQPAQPPAQTPHAQTPPAQTPPAQTPPAQTPPTQPVQPARDVWSQVRYLAQQHGRQPQEYTADEWNWFWSRVTGQAAPAAEDYGFTGDDRFRRVTFEVWRQRFTAAGYGTSGLGSAHRTDRTWQVRSPWEV